MAPFCIGKSPVWKDVEDDSDKHLSTIIKYQAAVPETGWQPQVFSGHLSVWGGLDLCRCTPRESAWSRCPSPLSPHALRDFPWVHCKTWPCWKTHWVIEAGSPITIRSLMIELFLPEVLTGSSQNGPVAEEVLPLNTEGHIGQLSVHP